MHKRLKILAGTPPQIVEGLQNAFVSLPQFLQAGFCNEQLVAPLVFACLCLRMQFFSYNDFRQRLTASFFMPLFFPSRTGVFSSGRR